MSEAEKILKKYKLRVTPVRKNVLNILSERSEALPHPEFERVLSEFDRVTIYRTLSTFEEKGLIHKIQNEQGVGYYALCSDECGPADHHDAHIHLECERCHKVFCLDEVPVPEIKIPANYQARGLKIITQGICKSCQSL